MAKHAIQYAVGGERIIRKDARWFVITPESGAWLYDGVRKLVANVPPDKGIRIHAQLDPDLFKEHNDIAWFDEYVGLMYPDQLRYKHDGHNEQWQFRSARGRLVFLTRMWEDDSLVVGEWTRTPMEKLEWNPGRTEF